MKYYRLALITALICILTLAVPAGEVFAFDSGNYTSVDIIFSDNITIESINGNLTLTINDLEDAMSNALEAQAETLIAGATTLLEYMVMFIILLAFTAFGYWHRDKVLIMFSGFGFIIYGFTLWGDYWWLSMLTVGAGIYLVFKAFWERRKANE